MSESKFLKKFKKLESSIRKYVILDTRLKESGELIKIKFEEMMESYSKPLSFLELKEMDEGITSIQEILKDDTVKKNLSDLMKPVRRKKKSKNK